MEKKMRISDFSLKEMKKLSLELMLNLDETLQYLLKWRFATFISKTINGDDLLSIEFDIMRYYDIEDKYNFIECVKVVDDVASDINENMIYGDIVVIPNTTISIFFEYPLSHPATFEYSSETGFTRRKILECVYQGYKKIYDEENETGVKESKDKVPIENRPRSNGKYGIWGHYIDQLFIEHLEFNVKTSLLKLGMGS